MQITAPCVVSLTWRLEDAQGQSVEELNPAMEFFYGGDDLFAKVEEALTGHVTGDEVSVALQPEDAFGDYDSALVCFEPREVMPENVVVGMQFEGLPEGASTPDMPADRIYTVTEVYPEHVVLDGNHPLAGIGLRIHVTVCDVREATEEEIEAGTLGDAGVTVLDGPAPDEPVH
ncbi:FKBP-type peptidyl-prolyl cis-trans isomerase [Roseateles terrae]|uniref:peptidylprolyl isomerase n=1 Tax=Roseateles terrae TaxID=431060 RepID=A0ABR6GX60_9BURK|nr:peptidylprolyl isomerase [Roseateles terrae]MBB3196700.1 FKBP-type peptidyl-prolyl cis-trans isomerase SlyD [Roseateles terrae]OWQ84942.1 peptidylprolyl isomerase [Roseateles terrae]